MASLHRSRRGTRKWRARRKRDGVQMLLGYYATKAEAHRREREFDRQWPRGESA